MNAHIAFSGFIKQNVKNEMNNKNNIKKIKNMRTDDDDENAPGSIK